MADTVSANRKTQDDNYDWLLSQIAVAVHPTYLSYARDMLRRHLINMMFSPETKKLSSKERDEEFTNGVLEIYQLTQEKYGKELSAQDLNALSLSITTEIEHSDNKKLKQEYDANQQLSEQADELRAKLAKYTLTLEEFHTCLDSKKLRTIILSGFPLTKTDIKKLVAEEIKCYAKNQSQTARSRQSLQRI